MSIAGNDLWGSSREEQAPPVREGYRWCSLYDAGVPSRLTPEHPTVLHAFQAALCAEASYPFLRYQGAVLSLKDVDLQSDALACALIAGGFRQGDRLAIYLQNVPEFVIGALAAWKLRGIVVTVNPMYRERELREVLGDSQAAALLCEEGLDASYVAAAKECGVRDIIDCSKDLLASGRYAEIQREFMGRDLAVSRPEGSDIATLIYTSGTTGPAKAAASSHASLARGAEVYRTWASVGPSDALIAIAPLVHVTGMVGYLALACVGPATLILTYRFSTARFAAAVKEFGATFTIGPTTAFIALTNDDSVRSEDLATLSKVYSGGAPIPLAVVERFEHKFHHRILGIYGMTEATGPTHMVPRSNPAPVDPASGTLAVGIAVSDLNCMIVDDDGNQVEDGKLGEIVMSGPQIAGSYWRREAESAAVFSPQGLRTGDIGLLDQNGWLYIVDRKKDLINASGFKIWPRDVEEVIYSHLNVYECAVIGVPDDYRGETVRAYVALRQHTKLSEQALVDFCRVRMAAYKVPTTIVFLDELPKTASGKILRRALKTTTD